MRLLSLLAAVTALALGLACSEAQNQTGVPASTQPVIVDTLRVIFDELQQAVLQGQPEKFRSLLDPAQADTLRKLIRKHGYLSLRSYIERQFANWPNLDTLELYQIRQSGSYVRLAYKGPGSNLGHRQPWVRYTFLLFKQHQDRWRLAAVTSIEAEQYDPYGYGYELSYHETDLPPRLRFPRLF